MVVVVVVVSACVVAVSVVGGCAVCVAGPLGLDRAFDVRAAVQKEGR